MRVNVVFKCMCVCIYIYIIYVYVNMIVYYFTIYVDDRNMIIINNILLNSQSESLIREWRLILIL